MQYFIRLSLLCFTFTLMTSPGFAQSKGTVVEKIEEFESETGTPVKLGYLEISTGTALEPLKDRLPAEAFPLVIIKKSEFEEKVMRIRGLQMKSMEYTQLARELAYVDSLSVLKDQAYFKVIEAERQRADLHKRTNQELNAEITRLSLQIDKTIDTGEKSLKGRNLKMLTTGILGGAIGLTTGLLVGVLVGGI
jgi:hypothetical protein